MIAPHGIALENGERVALVVRRHGFPVFLALFPSLALFFAPFLILPLVLLLTPLELPASGSAGYVLGVLTLSAYLLLILIHMFLRWIDYVLDVWVITSERIVNIKQRGLFSRIIGEHKLARVQDVTSEVHGAIPTLLRYGNVVVQTAGETGRFLFDQVPHPEEIVRTIFRLHDEAVKKQGTSPNPSL